MLETVRCLIQAYKMFRELPLLPSSGYCTSSYNAYFYCVMTFLLKTSDFHGALYLILFPFFKDGIML
jgi:hypothetical protein